MPLRAGAVLRADGSDVADQPIRMHVRGSSSAVEYAKKSFSLDPVDQIANLTQADTKNIPFLGETRGCKRSGWGVRAGLHLVHLRMLQHS